MAAKKMTPPPIDRPLSRAYLREFAGWSTAYPPGRSEPNSLRLMENMYVDRNGALNIRPGLRYLSYLECPDLDAFIPGDPGKALDRTPVGGMETFYTNEGDRAALFAVREGNGTVGFRALLFSDGAVAVHRLTSPALGFTITQTEEILNFSEGTTHVEYVQINNRILAMSDNGEDARMFFVGSQKLAKKLSGIAVPLWEDAHKLTAIHPDAAWINGRSGTRTYNAVLNPSFEIGSKYWSVVGSGKISASTELKKYGTQALSIESIPTRTNMQRSPLHDVASTGTAGWSPALDLLPCTVTPSGPWMRVLCDPGGGLFLAEGSKIVEGVKPRGKYRISVDLVVENNTPAVVSVVFYSMNGALIDDRIILNAGTLGGRFTSEVVTAPDGATTMRVSLGGRAGEWGAVNFRNLLVSSYLEPTDFFHGGMGSDYFWTGTANGSASVYHPPKVLQVKCSRVPVSPGQSLKTMLSVSGNSVNTRCVIDTTLYNKSQTIASYNRSAFGAPVGGWSTSGYFLASCPSDAVTADICIVIDAVARGEEFFIDGGMISPGGASGATYFDGSTDNTALLDNGWSDPMMPHESASIQFARTAAQTALVAETPTDKTLIATGGATVNTDKMAFFYTFVNEVGESAASKMTEIRMQRAWSDWLWQVPDAAGAPAGDTQEDELCADQIVVQLPQNVYDQAVAAGAIAWNLYAMSWSDQDPVPPEAVLAGVRDLFPDSAIGGMSASTRAAPSYDEGGWISVTPQRFFSLDQAFLPSLGNRINSSIPPKHRNGIVAGDRIILVGDPDNPAGVRWSSNRPGDYTNFSYNKGGGEKTLSSGNLNIPVSVALWQNPQSVDTLTVLCSGDDGRSKSYYMQPAKSESSSAGTVPLMGFEETTSTPGTVSPFGTMVLNNALFRPLDRALVKSTASNYNINHKTLSDPIINMWWGMRAKHRIMAATIDNRIYYLVNNANGENLEPGCSGNEIWVLDTAAETPHWSRLLVQAVALRAIDVGSRTFMGVVKSDGIYYFDAALGSDDYVDAFSEVKKRQIPWMFETNTQGANRAHDAWAHLQQIGITFGNFQGSAIYGVRGQSINGTQVDMWKRVQDLQIGSSFTAIPRWDFDDVLLVRRDMKEWYLYGRSVEGEESMGLISLVQYRYTPVTVNVGYEYGSIETQEYGRDSTGVGGTNTVDGIPVPFSDRTRP